MKVLMNGTTVIHCEPDGSRGVAVLLRLERSHGTLTWNRTPWNGSLAGLAGAGGIGGGGSSSGGGSNGSSGSGSGGGSSSGANDPSLFSNPDVDVTPGLKLKYGLGSGLLPPATTATTSGMGNASDGEVCGGGVEEGFLDIAALKEVALSCREGEFISIARRFGNVTYNLSLSLSIRSLPSFIIPILITGVPTLAEAPWCISLIYGRNLSDNRVTVFLCSPHVARHWSAFFKVALQAVRKQLCLGDRRLFWLKEQYLQLYFTLVDSQ